MSKTATFAASSRSTLSDAVFARAGLDDLQAGHLGRIGDLANRLPDDWSGMMGHSTLQEDFGAYRFQLAYMSYALALTHLHRLPAAPAVFRDKFDRLIQKMLSQDVWTYWRHVSTGNGPFNASLGELPPQWDPVASDNIMFSAYVQSMAALYQYLFNDDKYSRPGSITFHLKPLFWGNGGQKFEYDSKSLNEHLYWLMVEKGYLGIACEPNCVFQICNQPAILGFRLNDLLNDGDRATEVTDGYMQAWADFGITDQDGHFSRMVQEREHELLPGPPAPWSDFWLGALMHAWNPELVEAHYPAQMARWSQPGPEGSLWIAPSVSPVSYGEDWSNAQDFGWAAVCASEVGDTDTVERLLRYADLQLNPTWENGSYYYPRRDGALDDEGRLRAMDPHTGNVLLGYARLNVPNGLRDLYNIPIDRAWREQPSLVEMPEALDVRVAFYEPAARALTLGFRPGRVTSPTIELSFANIWGRGDWSLMIDGAPVVRGDGDKIIAPGRAQARRVDDALVLTLPTTAATLLFQWAAA